MGDRNALTCQHPTCVCGKMKEFQRGDRLARSLENMRVFRRGNVDIAEIWMESEDRAQSRVEVLTGQMGGMDQSRPTH